MRPRLSLLLHMLCHPCCVPGEGRNEEEMGKFVSAVTAQKPQRLLTPGPSLAQRPQREPGAADTSLPDLAAAKLEDNNLWL